MPIGWKEITERFPSLVANLEPSDLECFAQALLPLDIKAGAHLMESNEHTDSLYLVWEGELGAEITREGQTLSLGRAAAGHWIGEYGLIEPGPASATVTAIRDCHLLRLSSARLDEFRQACPRAAAGIIHVLARQVAERIRAVGGGILAWVNDSEYRLEKATTVQSHPLRDLLRSIFGLKDVES